MEIVEAHINKQHNYNKRPFYDGDFHRLLSSAKQSCEAVDRLLRRLHEKDFMFPLFLSSLALGIVRKRCKSFVA